MGGAMTALDPDWLQADESVGHAVRLKHTDETGNLLNALSQGCGRRIAVIMACGAN